MSAPPSDPPLESADPRPRRSGVLGWLAAIPGPAAVFAAAWMVLNPEQNIGAQARAFQAQLAQSSPEVVVLGASYASRDIVPKQLATRLGLDVDQIAILEVDASTAPIWYAVLKERVYAAGHRPRLIVLPVSLGTALSTTLEPYQVTQLLRQMPEPDAVVSAKTIGDPLRAKVQTLLSRRGDLRAPILGAFRDALPRLLLRQSPADVSKAATAVLGEHHEVADARALPGVESDAVVTRGSAEAAVRDPADSYLADIADLAEQNGAQVVLVLPPTAVDNLPGQRVGEALEAEVVRWTTSRGVLLLDLRDLPWDAADFSDLRHMRRKAASRLSDLIADGLLAADPSHPVAAGPALLPATVRREGTPPALGAPESRPGKTPCELGLRLPELEFLSENSTQDTYPGLLSPLLVLEGDRPLARTARTGTCTGTARHRGALAVSRSAADGAPLRVAWSEQIPDGDGPEARVWIYPGTTVTWEVPNPWPEEQGPGTVDLRVGVLGPGEGQPSLTIGRASVALVPDGVSATASAPLPAGGPWTVAIRSPPDGPFLFVDSFALAVGAQRGDVVAPRGPRALDLLQDGAVSAATEPPDPPALRLKTDDDGAWFVVPWRDLPMCTPLRVEHKGELMAEARRLKQKWTEGTRLTSKGLTFEPLEGTRAKKGYKVVYDPERLCDRDFPDQPGQAWIYPGDKLQIEVKRAARVRFGGSLLRLKLDVALMEEAPEGATLKVRVRHGDEVLLQQEIPAADLDKPLDFLLPSPVRLDDKGNLSVLLSAAATLPPALLMGSFEDR